MRQELTERQKKRVEKALRKSKFTHIQWALDTVSCSHKSHGGHKAKGITDLISGLGFHVPCGGIAGKAYAQVWKKP